LLTLPSNPTLSLRCLHLCRAAAAGISFLRLNHVLAGGVYYSDAGRPQSVDASTQVKVWISHQSGQECLFQSPSVRLGDWKRIPFSTLTCAISHFHSGACIRRAATARISYLRLEHVLAGGVYYPDAGRPLSADASTRVKVWIARQSGEEHLFQSPSTCRTR